MLAMANPRSDADDANEGGNVLDDGGSEYVARTNQQPALQIEELEDWSHIEDIGIRRRIQNRNAQRLFRAFPLPASL